MNGEGEIWVHTEPKGNDILITIKDSGQGIPPDVLPHIFEPFYTTKDVGQGIGLGLSISHKVIEDHGGSIEVESSPGEGSTFSICLPTEGLEKNGPSHSMDRDLQSAATS